MSAPDSANLADLERALEAVVAALDEDELIVANEHMSAVNAVVAKLDAKRCAGDAACLSRIAALHHRAQRASEAARLRLEKERSALSKPSQAAQVYRQYAAR